MDKGVGPQESGIYALYYKDDLVYVGEASKKTTKSRRTLRGRLNEHVNKIKGRQNITLDEMRIRYVTLRYVRERMVAIRSRVRFDCILRSGLEL